MIKLCSAVGSGIDCDLVETEVDIQPGLPGFVIVGLADKAVEEAKERVRAAIKNSGLPFPRTKTVANLAPAAVKKSGTAFDLPIALGILAAQGELQASRKKTMYFGELALDGKVRVVAGVLSATILAKELGFEEIVVPKGNVKEAALVKGIGVIGVESLSYAVAYLRGESVISPAPITEISPVKFSNDVDLTDIAGQAQAKRALEIVASGGHNLLMWGSPGSGKTMLAKALPGIMPRMTESEVLEVTKIYSAAGLLTESEPLITRRPFRAPHHTATEAAIIGGGSTVTPGEVALAHRGVLFLDEFPEFDRRALESLRQPIEEGKVTIARAKSKATFPARFTLVAAQNPCPCGYLGDTKKQCECTASQIEKYKRKVSGPMLDRIDLYIHVPPVSSVELSSSNSGVSSADVRIKTEAAFKIRLKRLADWKTNGRPSRGADLLKFLRFDQEAIDVLNTAAQNIGLSGRGYTRTLRVARTIADLEQTETVKEGHVLEALQYRKKDK